MARIHRGKGEAWLRGGQTFSHNVDMVMEVLGRLVILSLVWGMVCLWLGNNSSSDLEQEYGLQGVQAALFDKLGHPLPDKLSIKGLDGVERTYKNAEVPKLKWLQTSRQTFVWATYRFKKLFPHATLQDLLQMFFGPVELLEWLVRGTPAAAIKSVLMTGLNSLTHLVGDRSTFSIREWVNAPKGEGGFLFLSAPETHIDSLRPLLSFWVELVVGALLSRPEDNRPETWVMLDEFSSLGQIDSLATGPVRLRKYNGAMVLGLQQFSQLQDIYGHETATTIIGQCAHKLILRCQDPDTAKFMSDQLGRAQMRRVDESISYGANSQRDGVNINASEELEPVALPEDLMNQPAMQGFIKVASAREGEAFPAATLKFRYKPRPKIAEGMEERPGPTPTELFLEALQESSELIRQAEMEREAGEGPPALEETADNVVRPMYDPKTGEIFVVRPMFDPKTGEIFEPDAPEPEAAEPQETAPPAESVAANDEGGPRMVTPDERNPYDGRSTDPAGANEPVLPELAASGNLDRTSKLAVDAYRSRLDQQEHQRAFMQLYDRVRRDMEQANPLNGIAVWKGREGQRKGPADAWPFVSKDRTGDRDEPDGSDSFWTPQS